MLLTFKEQGLETSLHELFRSMSSLEVSVLTENRAAKGYNILQSWRQQLNLEFVGHTLGSKAGNL